MYTYVYIKIYTHYTLIIIYIYKYIFFFLIYLYVYTCCPSTTARWCKHECYLEPGSTGSTWIHEDIPTMTFGLRVKMGEPLGDMREAVNSEELSGG